MTSRDLARTRRPLLDAARQEITQRGLGASLAAIAKTAGVSKGGLLHHFSTKDSLFLAVAMDIYGRFDREYSSFYDADDPHPGRSARAYVRAMFASLTGSDIKTDYAALIPLLSLSAQIIEFTASESVRWSTVLAADGLSPHVVRIIICAADGAALGALNGHLTTDDQREIEQDLLTLIDEPRSN